MAGQRPRFFSLLVLVLLSGSALAAAEWSAAELAGAGAGEKLAASALAEKNLIDAMAFLEKYAPRLPSGSGKWKALATLAQLRELSGNFGSASEAWIAASETDDSKSADALLEASRCLIAVGETERSSDLIRKILATSPGGAVETRAKLLGAYADAFRREAGALQRLKAFALDPAYEKEKPTVLFLIARLFGDKNARDQLVSEFPTSPEALTLAGKSVFIASLPLWLLPQDRDALAATLVEKKDADAAPAKNVEPATAVRKSVVASESVILQVGLFKTEKNARSLAARLASKGFTPSVAARKVSGVDYWVVTVAPGTSIQDTTMRLKDAGFESFPSF